MNRSLKVAVIGAGFAGLAMARELQIEGHQVTVFDRNDRVGGTWLYDPRVETDPLGLDPAREIVHSSAYQSLRTNLPRHIMGFLDYPFSKKEGGFGLRNFPGHEEVLSFLEDFARDFGLFGSIRLGKDVVRVEQVNGQSDGWVVEWKGRVNRSELELDREVFEAVVLCNGKHTEPKIADFPGMHIWPGMQIHSHNYRTAEPFQDLTVVIIGNASSAHDLCKEISSVAKEVHQACRTFEKLQNSQNICRHPMIERAYEDGKVQFLDGSFVYADAIIHCTGYKYHFPFLKTDGMVTVDDNCVGPLYKHVFPPQLAPSLSFVGLPTRAIQSLVIELQAKWVAKVLSGKLMLPTQREMASSVEELYQHMKAIGWPKHHTHKLQQDRFEYENWLVSILGLSPLEKWREEMFFSMMEIISCYGEEYRDTWNVDKWIEEVEFNYFKRSS